MRVNRPVTPPKIKAPAKKMEMVANRVVGIAPKMGKPKSPDADPSMIKQGHHRYQ